MRTPLWTVVLFLSSLTFAVDPPKPTTPAPVNPAGNPTFTVEQQSKLQALVIRKQNIALQMNNLQQQYTQLVQQSQSIEAEGHKLELEYLKAAGVDPEKFTTKVDDKGQLLIVSKDGK